MKNGIVLLCVVVSVGAFAGMMRIKTDVQTLTRERLKLAQEQMELRETKRVLEAEWAHVASPLRLMGLADQRDYAPLGMRDVVVMTRPNNQADSTEVKVTGAQILRRALGQAPAAEETIESMADKAVSSTDDTGGDEEDQDAVETLTSDTAAVLQQATEDSVTTAGGDTPVYSPGDSDLPRRKGGR